MILVTGGAGYIGSHTIVEIIKAGLSVVVVDNLCNSSRLSIERVEKITGVPSCRFYRVFVFKEIIKLQTETRMLSLPSFTIVAPDRLMITSLFVTWNTWPFLLVSVPPVIVNK